jgi:uncharacterized protein
MAAYFFDSSALIKRFSREAGSAWILKILRPSAGHTIYIVRITGAEVIAGLARQNRVGSLSLNELDRGERRLRQRDNLGFGVVDISQTIVNRAIGLIRTHGLRGYDAIQLSGALEVHSGRLMIASQSLIFVSADNSLNKAALLEGLTVENPHDHP